MFWDIYEILLSILKICLKQFSDTQLLQKKKQNQYLFTLIIKSRFSYDPADSSSCSTKFKKKTSHLFPKLGYTHRLICV